MGFVNDGMGVLNDLNRWYKKLSGAYHSSGMSNKIGWFKNKTASRRNNAGEKAKEKYGNLCNWMQKEMKK